MSVLWSSRDVQLQACYCVSFGFGNSFVVSGNKTKTPQPTQITTANGNVGQNEIFRRKTLILVKAQTHPPISASPWLLLVLQCVFTHADS